MREIGGYFELEQLIHKEYYPNLIALSHARNSLLYVLKARKIRKLYIPFFLCNSVSDLCNREGYRYEYYHIDKNFMPVFEADLQPGEYLYVVNYYGQIDEQKAKLLHCRYGNVIFDNVQAFFQQPVAGMDTIYSCRKFFGVPDGAYLATDAKLDEPLPADTSKDRMEHVLGRFEGAASDYYAVFQKNDHHFDEIELRTMSSLTHNLLGAIDYSNVLRKRNDNYRFLSEKLSGLNPLELSVPVGPYAYPFYCKNGLQVKKQLAQKKIYVATLWPNVLDMDVKLEKDYAANILPLPCDQRYGIGDMDYVLSELFALI